MNNQPYSGMVVIGLREPHQFDQVSTAIHTGGGRAFAVPTHTIKYLAKDPATILFLQNPTRFDLAIFSSPNAVAALLQVATSNLLQANFELAVAGPGPQTTLSLQTAGFKNLITPPQANNMSTLLEQLGDLSTKQVALIQRLNAPPRTLQQLQKKCAEVVAIHCYQRNPTAADMWSRLDPTIREQCNCLLAYDAVSLQLLLELASTEANRLRGLPVGVHHPQIADKAKILGYRNIITRPKSTELLGELVTQIKQREQ